MTILLGGWQVAAAQQPNLAIQGTVRDVAGGLLPTVAVLLESPAVPTREAMSDGDGRFRFEQVPPGAYLVTVSLPGFRGAQRAVTVGSQRLTVDFALLPEGQMEEVRVFGARLAPTEEARRKMPGAVDVLTAEVLNRSHVFSTSEALRKVPGVTVRDEEGLGLRPNIAVRGLNPTRSSKILLLEDGIATAYAPYGDNASYYHPPIERFERIEVMKGAGQIAHGPVTVGAVVNYITPEPPSLPSISLGLTAGTRRFVDASLGAGGTWRSTGLLIDVMQKQSDGARENVFSKLGDVNLKVTRQLTPLHGLSLKLNRYTEDSQVTYSGLRTDEFQADPRQNPFANDRFEGRRVSSALTYRGVVAERILWSTSGYASGFERDWWRQSSQSNQRPNDSADPGCAGMANLQTTCGNEGRLRSYASGGVESRAHVALGGATVQHELDGGARFHVERQERLQVNGGTPLARAGALVEDNRRTTDAWSGFLLHQARWAGVTVSPGVRIERVAYGRTNRLLGVSGETAMTQLLPGLGVTLAPQPGVAVFGGVHRGFAPPRAEDVIANATGSVVDLDPERGWNYELGTRLAWRGLSMDATLFRLDYENQLVPASVAGGLGTALTNGGATLHQGVELGAGIDTARGADSTHTVYSRAALTWLPTARFEGARFSSVTGHAGVRVDGNRVPYAPSSSATVTFGYRHRSGLDAQVEAQQVGRQFTDDLNTVLASADGQRGQIPGFTYWNAAATWRLAGRVSTFLSVKNLLDRTFIVDRTRGILPGTPRVAQVGATVRF